MLKKYKKLFCWIIFAPILININACNYYQDPVRQKNLCRALSKHVEFQQVPATLTSPSQYKLCGDGCYPCESYTPIYVKRENLYGNKYYKDHKPSVLRKHHQNHKKQAHKKNSKTDLTNNPQSSLLLLRKVYERN